MEKTEGALFPILLVRIRKTGMPVPLAVTIVKNAGEADMEVIRKKGVKLERLRMTELRAGGEGMRLGICYRLESGDVVYVPEAPPAQGDVDGQP